MSSSKRPIDLTGDDDVSSTAYRPLKAARVGGDPPSSTPARSQASQLRYEEDGGNELADELDASQHYDASFVNYELYGVMQAKIVGVRYYNGHVTTGEMCLLVREANNQYDRNAIRVDNVRGQKIGHIARGNAAKLAPFMDSRALLVECATTGEKAYFECPIELRLYGSNDPTQRELLKGEMKSSRLPLDEFLRREREQKARLKAQQQQEKERLKALKLAKKGGMSMPGGAGMVIPAGSGAYAGGASQSEMPFQTLDDIMKESERFNPRNVEQAVEQFGLKEEDLAKMDMADQPAAMRTKMLPYQLQGLNWMLQKENPVFPPLDSKDTIQLWRRVDRNPKTITNIATNFSLLDKTPDLASGGILADDMGLGKTIQVISLLMADLAAKKQVPFGTSGATLILAPLSVMSNWSVQIEKHVRKKHALRVSTYHGQKRFLINPTTIANHDVVITTYETMTSEYWGKNKKAATVPRKDGLFSVIWRRLVLDEGHSIRNPAAMKSVAACNLLAQSRWVLTGTPIVNTLKDLYSMVKFLRLSGGVDRYELFNSALIRPVNQGSEQGHRLLQVLMRDICLRRKKEMAFIDLGLPELSEYVHKINFLAHEQEKYDALEAEAKGTLDTYRAQQRQEGGDSMKAYRHLLEILLRLRQVCNHFKLCGEKRFDLLNLGEQILLDLTPENKHALQEMLQLNVDAQEDCPVCLETPVDPIITACTHFFCYPCIEKVIEGQGKCPMCRAPIDSTAKLVRPAAEKVQEPDFDINESSSKIEALLSILQASRKKNDGTKTVIFSQWTSFLNIVQNQLSKEGYKFTRIDGTMSAQARDAALDALENDADCSIMLASLSVCSVGLNLVAANQVILADSWWAPAIEDQAVDRVHRLGQKRATTVFRLVMENSIEERVLKIQEDKRKLMMLAFAEKQNKRSKKGDTSSVAHIERLLGGSR